MLAFVFNPEPIDNCLAVAEDTSYLAIAPHDRVLPATCAVPQHALDALSQYARVSLERRWSNMYYLSTQPDARESIAASLACYGLQLLPPQQSNIPTRRSQDTGLSGLPKDMTYRLGEIMRRCAPNHAILSKEHLAKIIPQPTAARLVIYTDGSYFPDRKTAGIGVYFENLDIPPLALGLHGHQSVARAEIYAVWHALAHVFTADHKPLRRGRREVWVCTDSQYVVNAVNVNRETWQTANWLTTKGKPIANRNAFQRLFAEIRRVAGLGYTVFVHHVPAHFGVAGNDIADTLAKAGALL
ncbi:hypothetical protein LPJ70_002607 [Coemansia sp. RSA 2708]|nr:hypothetical protein LPJ70_002607 [Coemansia sp. RSA 2708]